MNGEVMGDEGNGKHPTSQAAGIMILKATTNKASLDSINVSKVSRLSHSSIIPYGGRFASYSFIIYTNLHLGQLCPSLKWL
jgi:hypothetical protein